MLHWYLIWAVLVTLQVIPLDITVELQKQIMSELEILYKCDSSYIITFYSAFFVENRISICTEYMDGGSLDVYRRIPEHVLGRISVAVVKGLTYLWSLKILHRDVKPSNMLVNTRGQVKLCDFGVSTQLVNSIAKTYVGTNAYMAPERISGEQYGIHSDVWSVGISFMELALGAFPYPQIQKNQGSLMLLQCIVDEREDTRTVAFIIMLISERYTSKSAAVVLSWDHEYMHECVCVCVCACVCLHFQVCVYCTTHSCLFRVCVCQRLQHSTTLQGK
ncbi:dual specificity mitogen-activated protein kinase kinase 5 isoform 3-T4 [Salvelinus alpinus]